jgi:hypothetical protein
MVYLTENGLFMDYLLYTCVVKYCISIILSEDDFEIKSKIYSLNCVLF